MYKIGDTINVIKFTDEDIKSMPYTVVDFTKDGYAICENKDEIEIIFAKHHHKESNFS